MLRSAPIRRRKARRPGWSRCHHPAIIGALSQTAVLRAAAPMITTMWLIDTIDHAVDPPVLEVQNAEGEELLFCALHYPLVADVTLDEIRLALNECPELVRKVRHFGIGVASENQPRPHQSPKDCRASHTFLTTLDDGSLVLGGLELKSKSLVLSVNSQGRATGAALCCPSCSAAWWASPWSRCKRSIRSWRQPKFYRHQS